MGLFGNQDTMFFRGQSPSTEERGSQRLSFSALMKLAHLENRFLKAHEYRQKIWLHNNDQKFFMEPQQIKDFLDDLRVFFGTVTKAIQGTKEIIEILNEDERRQDYMDYVNLLEETIEKDISPFYNFYYDRKRRS
jgi:hypothetical protein